MIKELEKMIDDQRANEKESLGAISTMVWGLFLFYKLSQGELVILSWKTLLMIVPGLFIGATAMIVPYLILYRGVTIILKNVNPSNWLVLVYSWLIKFPLELLFAWYVAVGFWTLIGGY